MTEEKEHTIFKIALIFIIASLFGKQDKSVTSQSTSTGPPSPPLPAQSSITDTILPPNCVIRKVSGGHIELANGVSGPSTPNAGDGSGDLVVGVALPGASPGDLVPWWSTGQVVPISGLPVGPIFRDGNGLLVDETGINNGDWTNLIGQSDGVSLILNIQPPFQWSS